MGDGCGSWKRRWYLIGTDGLCWEAAVALMYSVGAHAKVSTFVDRWPRSMRWNCLYRPSTSLTKVACLDVPRIGLSGRWVTTVVKSINKGTRSLAANLIPRNSTTQRKIFYRAAVQRRFCKEMTPGPSAQSGNSSNVTDGSGAKNGRGVGLTETWNLKYGLKLIKRFMQECARRDKAQSCFLPGGNYTLLIRIIISLPPTASPKQLGRISLKQWLQNEVSSL